jgi:glycosidase
MKNIISPDWIKDAIFYQIFPDRFANGDTSNDPASITPWGSNPTADNYFGGDLKGIIDHLDYLQGLGINALYLTPIFQAKSNHKYDTYDYYKIDPAFGDECTFKFLIEESHRRGMKIVLDGVFNHCGYDSVLFNDVREKGQGSKYSSWFNIYSYPVDKNEVNYQSCGGTWYLPKLNLENPDAREYLLDIARYWIREYGIDGWRLDVPWKVPISFWREFRRELKTEFPEIYLVGEIWRDPSPWVRGDTFDGVMNYALRNSILDYCVYDRMDAEDFNYELQLQAQIFGSNAPSQLNLLGSHDTPRILTLCSEEISRILLTITFLLTYVGAPMIYYGDEIGLSGGNDPDCRKCMPWDHESEWNLTIKRYYERLIQARLDHIALRRGNFLPLFIFNGIYAFQRHFENDIALIILNPRKAYYDIKIPYKAEYMRKNVIWCDLMTGNKYVSKNQQIHIDFLDSMTSLILFPMRESPVERKK